ncbi:MAG: hypothetical protein J6B39_02455 [Lachnospiraceae bacterium]|nr:hypothetical protein [Lachnospiraceae bacterium]
MALIDELYMDVCDKLSDYGNKLRQNRFKMEAAFSAYEAKSAANDRQLKAALEENAYRQSRIEAELALTGINSKDSDYTSAKYKETDGRLNALKEEAERLKEEHEEKQKALDREFKSSENRLISDSKKLKDAVREYLDSLELRKFAFILNSDKALFENAIKNDINNLSEPNYISIGTLRAPIPVHEEFVLKFAMLFQRNFDAATKTIALPAGIGIKKGQVIVVDYLSSMEQEMFSGLRNFVINISRYFVDEFRGKRQLLLFQNFPESYDAKQINDIRRLCVEAAYSGNIIIITHNNAAKSNEIADVLRFIKTMSVNIESKMGGFFMEINKKREIAAFKWYSTFEKAVTEEVSEDEKEEQSVDNSIIYMHGKDKGSILHTVINSVLKNNHPDDVELWLLDFDKFEFNRYVKYLPPHVRYLICDNSPELVFDIIDRLIEVLAKRQQIFRENGWKDYNDIPDGKYMPVIVVVIDGFSAVTKAIAKDSKKIYGKKLRAVLEEGEAAGFRFVMAANDDGEELSAEFIEAAKERIWDYNTENAENITIKDVNMSPLCIMERTEQEEFIRSLRKDMWTAPVYSATNQRVYIDKQSVVIDGNAYTPFSSVKEQIRKCILKGKIEFDNGESQLFLGEARRIVDLCPIVVERESFENMAVIAPDSESNPAASVIISIKEGLELQDVGFEVWGSMRSNVFKALQGNMAAEVFVARNMEDIKGKIKDCKQDIMAQKRADKFIVLMGFESLLGAAGNAYTGLYDVSSDFRFILTYGPHLGYHFILVFGSEAEYKRSNLQASIFRHKIVFSGKEHSFRYSNEAGGVTFKPFLQEGLSWDGWKVEAGKAERMTNREEYLL